MTKAERACQIWSVLAWAARNRQTMTYGHLSKLTGLPAIGIGKYLDPIQSFCRAERLPPMTCIVVQSDSGLPGQGFESAKAVEFARAQKKVFGKDWLAYGNPQPEKFKEHISA